MQDDKLETKDIIKSISFGLALVYSIGYVLGSTHIDKKYTRLFKAVYFDTLKKPLKGV